MGHKNIGLMHSYVGDRALNYWIAGGNKAKFVVCGMATCHSCAIEN